MTQETSKNEELINPTEVCYRAFELIRLRQFEDAEKLVSNCLAKVPDEVSRGIFHSTLGVLYKMKGDYKEAWRHYERAEKLLPNDPALKIISARLLIDKFNEFDSAIKKSKKVLELIPNNPVFRHQAFVTMGLAYLKKGSRSKAIEMHIASMEGSFEGFISAKNIDFNLCEALLKKKVGEAEVKLFIERANEFAKKQQEPDWVDRTGEMLKAFETAA